MKGLRRPESAQGHGEVDETVRDVVDFEFVVEHVFDDLGNVSVCAWEEPVVHSV